MDVVKDFEERCGRKAVGRSGEELERRTLEEGCGREVIRKCGEKCEGEI